MMNPQGGQTNSMPGMDMPGDTKSGDTKSTSVKDKYAETNPAKDNSMPGMDMPANPKPVKNNTSSGNVSTPATLLATFVVFGNCEMCKDRIEKAAKSVKGVESVIWDVKTKKITAKYIKAVTNPDAIQKAIARAGHDTDKYKADDKVYNELPECCKYRN